MNRATLRSAACMLSLAASLLGSALPQPASADDRLVARLYNDHEVVRIDGKAGVQATIAFGDGEAIENVAVGDSQAWQITPNKRADLLFVKPLEVAARTNMTVVTNRHTYFFDLVASPRAKPLYMLRFTYRDEPKPQAGPSTVPGALNPAEQALAANDPMALPSDAADLNRDWKREGSARLLPAQVYDDGSSTYLLWPEKMPVPAILVTNEKGDEGPVNYAVRDATIVIDAVPDLIVLRSGKAKAQLVNARPLASRPVPVRATARPASAALANASAAPAAAVPTAQGN
ncbi:MULTISPECIES: TrbG/VirB9 family P-type conjugative transfer protein [Novosphingobium]|jgi:type IV secretion system protein VirB9|uniref:Type IV secretion system protein VirB9 n=1 Tax=Novosphingobium panipatense TaxID=428991 RepID=A0ABY1PXG0_9SPHN|nr:MULTISPECIES: TrbG/VirB9 family P-type conjugative transfer protein [Novosphingobium]SMP51004.1 type IV secretion system protein VirB9 [Novosphingobium panipatense]